MCTNIYSDNDLFREKKGNLAYPSVENSINKLWYGHIIIFF